LSINLTGVAMHNIITPHAVVALTKDLPEHGLLAGQVGTVVETLAPDTFEVEFSDDDGRAYAFAPVTADRLLLLRYAPAATAAE
jgi:carbonic anhydrase/acetyltransferase-like protein (isoleucine patch superfamily)